MGTWLLFLAYITSAVGSTVGLACTLQARYAGTPRSRIAWLILAAVSIGGVGIWVMHFIAMLGFATPGMPVRYDIVRTGLSAILSVSAVFLGLLVFGVRTKFVLWRLLVGGVVTGLAVGLMHYTGMWAVQVKGQIGYDLGLAVLSIVIAVIAATAALWFTVAVDRLLLRVVAGLVMGVAVTGMHYTGMAAVRVQLDAGAPDPSGAEVFSFLFPVFVLAAVALAVPICAALMAASPAEKEAALHPKIDAEPPRARSNGLSTEPDRIGPLKAGDRG
ncbi:MAG TPA: signal protein [Micromonosporaceae bacterium]|nr:signal protein [Micromonosporaceae bacterium]